MDYIVFEYCLLRHYRIYLDTIFRVGIFYAQQGTPNLPWRHGRFCLSAVKIRAGRTVSNYDDVTINDITIRILSRPDIQLKIVSARWDDFSGNGPLFNQVFNQPHQVSFT